MKLTFHGAARQVTGSMFLLELEDGYKVLIDCGTDFETRKSVEFSFNPAELDLVLLTHAHLDHTGNIPNLYLQGYTGQVLCTGATFALTQLILNDAAAIHSKNIKRKLKRKKFGGRRIADEGYLEKHVEEASECFVTIAFNQQFEVNNTLSVTFIPTGHLLGAANILVKVKENGQTKSVLFSGDIGRSNYPLLQDPCPVPNADYVICETTYGSRIHSETEKPEDFLLEVIKESCVDKPGRLIIPSFSVGRTQSLLFTLNKLHAENRLPRIKVFADSPMAEACTRIYENHLNLLNPEAQEFYEKKKTLFDFENLICTKSYKESKAISNYHEPCIILSSSGMITGGRIQEHIKKNLSNQYCTILLVGYSAEGTAGYSLFKGEKYISVKGRSIPVQARILYTDVFSGHGDQHDLMNFVRNQNKSQLKQIFLVHGEPESMDSFKSRLAEEGYHQVCIPRKHQTFEL
jgi:metallo-beta-lactamase family protein